MRRHAHEILGRDSNWLVIDNGDDFARVVHFAHHGIIIDNVPEYGALHFRGPEAFFSADNEHPTNFGYALWAQLIVESAIDVGVSLAGSSNADAEALREPAHDRRPSWDDILRRTAREVRRAPGF